MYQSRHCLLLLSLFAATAALAQQPAPKPQVFFSDLDNFWVAYDSIRTTSDSLRQLGYLNRLYLAKATPGLQAFQEVKGYAPADWVSAIRRYPRFWNSIRPNTLQVKTRAQALGPYLQKFAALYPALRPAAIYYTIGALQSGGTTQGRLVLIGTELAVGDPATDISEFPANVRASRASYFQSHPLDNLVVLNVHEYVHTQEKGPPENNLLGQALYEGTCDFVAELVTGRLPQLPYVAQGPRREPALKAQFQADMFAPYLGNWFYNQVSDDPAHVPDLGYYMGYAICKAYYQRAHNKPQAVKDLLELDYTNADAVEALLRRSGYYPHLPPKAQLLQAYEASRPVVVGLSPAPGPDGLLDAATTEIRVDFSAPMARFTGTDYGPGGEAQWPIAGRGAFSADHKSYTYKVALKPGHPYGFVINGGGFRSADGRPLKTYEVKFTTKP
jgi:hypothetical protein